MLSCLDSTSFLEILVLLGMLAAWWASFAIIAYFDSRSRNRKPKSKDVQAWWKEEK